MAEHVPPTEEQLGEIERLARKRDWDGYNAFLLRCIAEIRGLRARETALAEWCKAASLAAEDTRSRRRRASEEDYEYYHGYSEAMEAAARRIREALK